MTLRRMLGWGGPSLAQITYGSMRMTDSPERPRPLDVLLRLHDAGIDTHHSSSEYDSYPLYLETLQQLRQTGREVCHIVKLAEPSFDHTRFEALRLGRAIDARLAELGTDCLDVVQWMVRTPDPLDERRPYEIIHHQRHAIVSAFDALKRSGKVGEFAIFPYSDRFADAALHELGPYPLCGYLSLFETDSLELLRNGQSFIALRPFAGAVPSVVAAPESVRAESDPTRRFETALRYPLQHPGVATTVVSVNQEAHIDLAINVAQSAEVVVSTLDREITKPKSVEVA